MYKLTGRIQHYTWGGNTYLPGLLNQSNTEHLPYAEYWLGVHPGGPTTVHLGQGATTSLAALVKSDIPRHLGNKVANQFRGFPFLLKILDVNDMLSIQVHPTKEMAEIGYANENEKGIALDAHNRNYKDNNHKPEMMVALSDFWLLHGFSKDIEHVVSTYDFLKPYLSIYTDGGIKSLYAHLLNLPQEQVNHDLSLHANKIIPLYQDGKLAKSSPDFWAARAILNLCKDGKYDKGIYSIYLMNILQLQQGEGVFQGAGLLHAYLEGQNIELMSNSDNVLRAGLTNKHIDIPELLAQTSFEVTHPQIIPASFNTGVRRYPSETKDFMMEGVKLSPGQENRLSYDGPSICLVLEGDADWKGYSSFKSEGLTAVFVEPNETIVVKASTDLEVFVATVPA